MKRDYNLEGGGGPDNDKREEGGKDEGYNDGVEGDVPTGADLWDWLLASANIATDVVTIAGKGNSELWGSWDRERVRNEMEWAE